MSVVYMSRFGYAGIFAMAVLGLAGCTVAASDDLDENTQLIVNGIEDGGHRAVGRVFSTLDDGRQVLCSGTLIGNRTVLTAAHCLPQTGGAEVTFRVGRVARQGTAFRHPEYDGIKNDVGVIRLRNGFPSVVPARPAERTVTRKGLT